MGLYKPWFFKSLAENFESIHNHDAFAKVERGEPGPVMHPKRAQEEGNPVL